MTDKRKYPSLQPIAKGAFLGNIAFAALLSSSVFAQATDEQQWWFDVEVILFERNLDTASISEKFQQSRLSPPARDHIDLLTSYLNPDLRYLRAGLPYCRGSQRLTEKMQYAEDFSFPLPLNESNQSALLWEDEQQFNAEPTTEFDLSTPPIEVEFIEWQIPSDLLCAYTEQIDPSFASIIALQNTQSDPPLTKQIKPVPKIINGTEWQQKRGPFLLPTASMRMGDLYDKINRQRDITPILHVNWRQEVTFGRENAHTFRLFAGENFAAQFDANGLPLLKDTDSLIDSLSQPTEEFYIPEQELLRLSPEQQKTLLADKNGTASEFVTEDLFAKIDTALADGSPISLKQLYAVTEQQSSQRALTTLKEIWQLDGGITLYLRNVGRVPYLHIDSNLDFRQPIFDPNTVQNIEPLSTKLSEEGAIAVNQLQQPNYLQSVNFNQLRRVISKQVHYFDHPLFGMVVLIHRYRWPEAEPEAEQQIDTNDAES